MGVRHFKTELDPRGWVQRWARWSSVVSLRVGSSATILLPDRLWVPFASRESEHRLNMSIAIVSFRRAGLIWLVSFVVPLISAVGEDRLPLRPGGRSSQRAVLHTADSLESIQARIKDKSAVIIDVREQDEWDAGHLQGAVFLPLSQLKQAAFDPELRAKLARLSKDKVLYCHCKAGGRTLTAAPILKSLGYDARPLKAGYDELIEAGFEQDSTAKSR